MSLDTGPIEQRQRAIWAAGDYPDVARTIAAVA
jgi:hypothetical protein